MTNWYYASNCKTRSRIFWLIEIVFNRWVNLKSNWSSILWLNSFGMSSLYKTHSIFVGIPESVIFSWIPGSNPCTRNLIVISQFSRSSLSSNSVLRFVEIFFADAKWSSTYFCVKWPAWASNAKIYGLKEYFDPLMYSHYKEKYGLGKHLDIFREECDVPL